MQRDDLNLELKLCQRRRRWTNIKTTLIQRLVFVSPGPQQARDVNPVLF